MNCRIAEGMVNKYINHTLPLNDLEDCLEHIENCSSCYDELDEKQEDSVLDFKELLEEDIRKSRRYIRRRKIRRAIAAAAFCVLIAALVIFLIFVILELKEGI